MKLNPITLGIASAITTAVLWVICSLLVVLLPGFMTHMTAGMMHDAVASISLTMTWLGFIYGLICWVISAAIAAWLLAIVYNQLLPE
ncbi:MAG: hypothetical protein ACI9N9_002279 [Enterobacterales bacterium]|jgi:hypothetical protein